MNVSNNTVDIISAGNRNCIEIAVKFFSSKFRENGAVKTNERTRKFVTAVTQSLGSDAKPRQ